MCALRARLNYKLETRTGGGLNDWLQKLYDNPPLDTGMSHTWVTLSKKWLKILENDMSKYNRIITNEDEDGTLRLVYDTMAAAPLRPWAQLGKALEMSVRANGYTSETMSGLRTAFLGQTREGLPLDYTEENPLICPRHGELEEAEWEFPQERWAMDLGRIVPQGRTHGEVTRMTLVCDMVLERLMASNKSKGFNQFYDVFNLGTTRGYLREAANRPDLAEGVWWLSMIRTKAFPTVEGAWQCIKHSGQIPTFEQGKCPLCAGTIRMGWEWVHLIVECNSVVAHCARQKHLQQSITYIKDNLIRREHQVAEYAKVMGREEQNRLSEVLSIYLIGGLFQPTGLSDGEGWFDTYFVGFGASRLICLGFESFGYAYIVSFLQTVAPKWVTHLGESLGILGDEAIMAEELDAGSKGDPIDQ